MPERPCSCCYDTEFDEKTAVERARDYARNGAPRATRLLADGLAADATGLTVLDIGAGIGALHHVLLERGAEAVVDVDASGAYLEAARQEARRRGFEDRVRFEHGDFVEISDTIEPADLVALDRSVCCYPHMDLLVGLAAARARRRLGIVVPRDLSIVRFGIRLINAGQWLRRSAFRVYGHDHDEIAEVARNAGLTPLPSRHVGIWTVLFFDRAQTA